jgi:hypothetical protein
LRLVRAPPGADDPPDPAAARFFLTNRRAKEWRERQEVEHSGEVKLTLEQALAQSMAITADPPSKPEWQA